ncbi:hypothetical protein FRC02_004001 [Tulasnella sp. 418]|nr:hypothetical protein FRC02_004001 [Tulasnella sp. 418]
MIDHTDPAVIRAARALLDFLYIAQYQSHSDETLLYLEEALQLFHKDKDIFLKLGAREADNFNLPKLHSLLHYADAIRELGTIDNYNTEATERLHINLAKDAYRASNRRDFIPQMIVWVERKEKIENFASFVTWRKEQIREKNRDDMEIGNEAADLASQPIVKRRVQLAKWPAAPGVSLQTLSSDYHAIHFSTVLEWYLRLQRRRLLSELPGNLKKIPSTVTDPPSIKSIPVWHRIKFIHPNVQGMDFIEDTQDTVHAYPKRRKRGSKEADFLGERFDTVLVNEKGEADITGVEGLHVGQVRVVFKLPDDVCSAYLGPDSSLWPGHLVYIEWFSKLKANPEKDHKMF